MKTSRSPWSTRDKNLCEHKWSIFKALDSIIAISLVLVSIASAEPPLFNNFARQSVPPGAYQPVQPTPAPSAPYAPRGWRPQGAPFKLPERSQPQQTYATPAPSGTYGAPAPGPSYGPPPEEPEPATTVPPPSVEYTTDSNGVTPAGFPDRVRANAKIVVKAAKVQQQRPEGVYYALLPQSQNLVYEVQKSQPFVALPQTSYVTAGRLQALPLSTNIIFSPLSASYVELYK